MDLEATVAWFLKEDEPGQDTSSGVPPEDQMEQPKKEEAPDLRKKDSDKHDHDDPVIVSIKIKDKV